MPRPTRVPDSGRLSDDERGVSVAVNHVLSIGITTILITGLIFAAGNVLEAQRGAATDQELRTIGNRIANQVETAEATATSNGGTVVLKTDHPDRVTGSKYTVQLSTDCDLGSACLKLSPTSDDKVVEVALRNETRVIEDRVADGTFWIVVSQDGITLSTQSPGPVGNQFDSPTGARVASGADYTGPYARGGIGGPTGPKLNGSTDIRDISNGNKAEYEVDYTTTKPGDLKNVTVTFTGPPNGSDSSTNDNDVLSYTGSSGSYGNTYTITIEVYDTNGDLTDSCTVTDTADGSDPTVNC